MTRHMCAAAYQSSGDNGFTWTEWSRCDLEDGLDQAMAWSENAPNAVWRVADFASSRVYIVRDGSIVGIREDQDPLQSGSVIAGNEALFDPFRKLIRG